MQMARQLGEGRVLGESLPCGDFFLPAATEILDPRPPTLERQAHLLQVFPAVVDPRHTALAVIQDLPDHETRGPERGEVGSARPAQIVGAEARDSEPFQVAADRVR